MTRNNPNLIQREREQRMTLAALSMDARSEITQSQVLIGRQHERELIARATETAARMRAAKEMQ